MKVPKGTRYHLAILPIFLEESVEHTSYFYSCLMNFIKLYPEKESMILSQIKKLQISFLQNLSVFAA